jgi:asparagine synthase (glutamine-hydrolysing)
MYNFFYRLVSLSTKRDVEIYFSAGMDIFEDYEQWLTSSPESYIDPIRQDFNKIVEKDISGLRKIMNMDFNTALCCDFLVKMDIANMSNSLEGRSPFLCRELLEYAPTMNDSYKVQGKITKNLLRQLSKKYLPEEIISQPKRGFEIPLKNWVDNELKEIVYDYVGAKNSLWSEFVQREFIEKLLNNRVKISAEKRAKILWTLMSMEIWYKKVYLQ